MTEYIDVIRLALENADVEVKGEVDGAPVRIAGKVNRASIIAKEKHYESGTDWSARKDYILSNNTTHELRLEPSADDGSVFTLYTKEERKIKRKVTAHVDVLTLEAIKRAVGGVGVPANCDFEVAPHYNSMTLRDEGFDITWTWGEAVYY